MDTQVKSGATIKPTPVTLLLLEPDSSIRGRIHGSIIFDVTSKEAFFLAMSRLSDLYGGYHDGRNLFRDFAALSDK